MAKELNNQKVSLVYVFNHYNKIYVQVDILQGFIFYLSKLLLLKRKEI